MVEGAGSRDFATTRTMAYADPALFGRLMDILVKSTIEYLSAQITAGAETVMLFDTWAACSSPLQFRQHVITPARPDRRSPQCAPSRRAGDRLPASGRDVCGDYAERTGVDGVALDTGTDPARAAATLPDSVAVQGNLDPIALLAGGAAMRAEISAILDALSGRPHIFNLGHGILPQTNPDHVAELVEFLRNR